MSTVASIFGEEHRRWIDGLPVTDPVSGSLTWRAVHQMRGSRGLFEADRLDLVDQPARAARLVSPPAWGRSIALTA